MEDKWNKQTLRLIARRLELDYNTVLDIGVAHGTPELYKAFNKSNLVLIEPLERYEPSIEKIEKKYKAKWIKSAAGSENTFIDIIVDDQQPSMSSFHQKDMASSSGDVYKEKIPVKKLDTIVEENKLKGPFIIKIDTEGHEIEVLKGAKETLKNCCMIIAEVSVANRFKGGYKFSEFIKEMSSHGFELLDVLSFTSTPPKFIDAVFTKIPWKKKIGKKVEN